MQIPDLFRSFRRSFDRYTPLIEVAISRDNLLHNLHTYQKAYPELQFAPVLKSNAYGHDIGTIARLLDAEKIAFFMVDSLYEARRLRHASIRSRILVMGYVRPADLLQSNLRDVDYSLTDLEQIRELAAILTHPLRVHIKIDTGMRRQGILPEDVETAIDLLRSNTNIRVVGVCSHFASADEKDPSYSKLQIARWHEAAKPLRAAFPSIEYRHIAATKGMRFAKEADTNVARLGIGLYGFDTAPAGGVALKPVLELRTIVSSTRKVPAGESVGYNATYTTTRPTTLATIPLGYYEGMDRRLSGIGSMLVRRQTALIAGRVSMNISSLDVTDIPNVSSGDQVIAISRDPAAPNCISALATLADTTPYVLLAHIPAHLRRVVE